MDNQELINELNNKIVDLLESYSNKLPTYEVGHAFIMNATSMLLHCAPNELIGIKTVLASVTNGISSYEETHS
jgi:hypothetical protein